MKTALVVGGTGLIGKQLMKLLVADDRYSKIVLLLRKPIYPGYDKTEQVLFNFDHPNRSVVVGDEIYCCLGTTIRKAGSQEAFFKVDHDHVSMIAGAAYENGAKSFAMVSAMGANKNSAVYYNKVKGRVEETVTQIGYKAYFIFRPSLLLGQRNEFRFGESIAKLVMTSLSFAIPKKYKAIEAKQVAKGMIAAMNSGMTGVQIIESDKISEI